MDISKIWVSIGADIDNLLRGLGVAQSSTDSAANNMTASVGDIKAAWLAAGAAAAAFVGVVANVSNEVHKSQNQLQASLGVTAEEAKKLSGIVRDVFANNFGDSIADVTTTLQAVRSEMKGLSDEDLKGAVENAYRLRDVFGVDVQESIGAAKTLMSEFGMSQKQAYDFITKGMQDGLNASGDFLDTIGEYSNQFAGAKLSASEFYSTMQTGLKGGVLGTDKIADAIKEFGIRIVDGSKTSTDALGELGLSWKKLEADFASGKLTKADALKMVQERLKGVDDQIKQNAIGTGLFGTQWEDLGAKAILSVDIQKTAIEDLADSTSGLDVKYNDIGTAITGLGRKATVAFAPIGDAIVSLINSALPLINGIISGITLMGNAFNALPAPIKNTITAVGVLSAAVLAGIAIYGAGSQALAAMGLSYSGLRASVAATAASVRASSIAIGTSISAAIWPITLVAAAIAGLYLAYKNNFLGIRDLVKPLVDNIIKIVSKIVDGIRFVVYNSDTLWKGFISAFKLTVSTLGSLVKAMGTVLSGVGLILYAVFIEPWVPVFNALQTAGTAVMGGLQRMVQGIARTLKPVFDLLVKMGVGVGQALQTAMNAAGDFIGNVFGDAAGKLSAVSKQAQGQTSTLAKGIQNVTKGFNDGAAAVAAYRSQLSGIAADTKANLKTPPAVTVPNAKVPAITNTGIPTPKPSAVPSSASYAGADASSDSGKGKGKGADKGTAKADQPYKATAEDVKTLSTSITRLMQDQKRLIASGKMTEDQAISYKRKVEDIYSQIDKLNLENNKYVTGLYAQAKGHIEAGFAAAKSAAAKAADAEATRIANEQLAKQLDWLKGKVADMSDAEIASTIARLNAAKSFGYQKKEEILLTEQLARQVKKQEEAFAASQQAIEDYADAVNSVGAAIADMQDTTDTLANDTFKQNLDNRMNAELEAADENESAKLEIKKRYAPQLLAIEEKAINDESNRKAAALSKSYYEALAIANREGIDTTSITQSYLAARQAINENAESKIAGVRLKSAADIAKETLAIEKQLVAERVRINTEAANSIADAYLDNLSELDTAGMVSLRGSLETLRDSFSAMGEDGVDSVIAIDKAINKVDDSINSASKDAIKGFSDIAKELKPLGKEFDDLMADPDSKESFVSKGVAGFDTLISKYDDLITQANAYADTVEGAGDKPAADAMRAEAKRLAGIRDSINAARGTKSTELGAQFDKEAADAATAVDNQIKANQLANAGEVADFKVRKLEAEKAAKLSLATTDAERAQIELSYVDKIKQAQLDALATRKTAADEALRVEMEGELSKKGLTDKQKEEIKAYYAAKKALAEDAYEHEREQIKQTSDESEKAQKKVLNGWKDVLAAFVKDMASAVSGAYKTIYENNQKLNSGTYGSQEDLDKAREDTAKANGEAAKNAGIGIFNAAVTGLKAVFPEFAYFIDLIGGLLGNMPQLGVVFQRLGEIFLVVMDILAPVIEMLATILEPLLNILKVLLESVIKPLMPVLTFFLKVTATIITTIYNMIKTIWNAVAGFLNGINILGWKPFNLSYMPELQGSGSSYNSPSVGNGSTGGNTSNNSGNSTENRTNNINIYVNEASDADAVARLVERRLIKSLA